MKTIEVRNNYVYVYYDETNDVETLTALMQETAEACKKANIKKILADLSNMSGKASIINRFRLGIAAVRIFRGMSKIAIISKDVETNRFAETVAINRGLPSLITHDVEKAKHWLEVE